MINRIKELREEKGMTQQRLSIELGVTQEAVSGYENGRHFISMPCLLKLSKMFNVSCDYILCLSDIRNITAVKDLSHEEIKLISDFRTLLPSGQWLKDILMVFTIIEAKRKAALNNSQCYFSQHFKSISLYVKYLFSYK